MDCLIFSTLRESLHDVNSSANSNFNNNNSNQIHKGSSSSSSSSSQSSGGNNGYDTHPSSSSRQQNKIIDQISISTKINKFHDITAKEGDNMHYYELEEELRSSILNLSLLDVKMKKLRDGKI